jgi:hypothetical protein
VRVFGIAAGKFACERKPGSPRPDVRASHLGPLRFHTDLIRAPGILAGPRTDCDTTTTAPEREIAMKRMIVAISVLVLASAVPAAAAPNPSPVAPAHTGTACANVLAKNPQAGTGSHSAPPAQQNFFEVGAAFCGIS